MPTMKRKKLGYSGSWLAARKKYNELEALHFPNCFGKFQDCAKEIPKEINEETLRKFDICFKCNFFKVKKLK